METTEQQYAVIRTGGKQYRVTDGMRLSVEKLTGEVGATVEITDVMLVGSEADIKVGTPRVEDAVVVAEIVAQRRGPKLTHFRYKNKTHGGTRRGHRQSLTDLKVTAIKTAS